MQYICQQKMVLGCIIAFFLVLFVSCSEKGDNIFDPNGTEYQAPAIISQPASVTVLEGKTATFSVTATGTGLSYQWYKSGSSIYGGTGASYTMLVVDIDDDSSTYYCTVSNSAGSVTSSKAYLYVNAINGFDLDDGTWSSTRISDAITSIPVGDIAVFTGTLTEEILEYIGTAVESRTTNIAIDLSRCTELVVLQSKAFSRCSKLTSITIPDGVTTIGDEAFDGCSGLTSITIPSSVTTIEYSAFSGCNSLATVNYTGSETQWNAITIGDYNADLFGATINYNY